MPIVIDANRAGDFSAPLSGLAPEILHRIRNRSVKVVVGGKLLQELSKTRFRSVLVELGRVGLLINISHKDVEAEQAAMLNILIVSDDIHVLALLRKSNCRLIYTDDTDLITDIHNPLVLSPQGCALRSTTSVTHARPHLARSAG